jgi:Protein of unknown function (DUF2848)
MDQPPLGWQPRQQPCHTSTDLSPVPIDYFECKTGSPNGIRLSLLVIPCGSKGAVPRTSWRLVANVNQIQMTLWKGDTPQKRMVALDQVVIAGWTGRDTVALNKHIEELKELGIAPPTKVPCFFRASVNVITTQTDLQYVGSDGTGEVEFYLVSQPDGLWVGVASEHTDRKVETYSIPVSKQLCQKAVSPDLWSFDDVRPHWDRLVLRAHISEAGKRKLYQEGPLGDIRHPDELISKYTGGGKLAPGTLMFGGTFSAIGGVRPAPEFFMELEDPVRGRKLTHQYRIHTIPWEE